MISKAKQQDEEPTNAAKTNRKNFGLSQDQFDQMLHQLRRGKEDLYQKIFFAHFGDCTSYLQRHLNADPTDAYDAAVDTLVVFGRKLKEGKIQYGNLRYLFTQMAIQSLYHLRKKKEHFVDLEEADELIKHKVQVDNYTMDCLAQAWEKLGEPCQIILRGFYYDNTPLQELATILNKSEVAVRKQKQRCMQKLQSFFKDVYPKKN